MFNREIQVRTVKVPPAGSISSEDDRVQVFVDYEAKVDVITKATKSVIGTMIVGLLSYIVADTARKVIVNSTTKRPYWVKPASEQ